MSFDQELKLRTASAEEIVTAYLPSVEGHQKSILSAMEYSVSAGGKRLRPVLIREAYRFFGGKGKAVEPFMAAMEMIHTHSLVHDDLPALDNDEYRRGKKTTHVVYGEAMAILSGDALLNLAYETACKAFAMDEDCSRIAKALSIMAAKTGCRGMLGGQCVDVEMEGKPLTEEQLSFIYELKTGALLEASLMIGAALAGASDENIADLEQIGSDIGLAFQIQDDILDVEGDEKLLGKPIGSDEKNGKTTFVTLYGVEAAHKKVEESTQRAEELLDRMGGENTFLKELLGYLAKRSF